jgi:hypothetical protein
MPVMYLAGKAIEVPDDQVQTALDQGYTPESAEQHAQRLTAEQRESDFGGVKGKVAAGTPRRARCVARPVGRRDRRAERRRQQPRRPARGEPGRVARRRDHRRPVADRSGRRGRSHRWQHREDGRGRVARHQAGRGAAGYGVEGGLQGLGQGVSELALSDDPLTAERIASVLTSNTLLGGGIGAGAGTIGKLAESGILRAKGALDEIAAGSRIGSDVTGDLAGMDAKALRGAHEAELGAIEAQRVPQRAQLADEIKSFRQELKEQKIYLATKGAEERELREIGKRSLDADRQLDRLLNNPKRMAEKPELAKAALQQQEAALEDLAKNAEQLKVKFAGDTSGERLAALENSGKALERNRELQRGSPTWSRRRSPSAWPRSRTRARRCRHRSPPRASGRRWPAAPRTRWRPAWPRRSRSSAR